MTKPKPEQDAKTGRFLSGNSGGGRSKGSRNKLGEAFLADMFEDWSENGKDAIAVVRKTKPDAYLKVVANILPKELNIREGAFDHMTDDELARELASISAQLAAMGASTSEGEVSQDKGSGGAGWPTKLH